MEDSRFANADDLATIVALAANLISELTPMRGGEIWSKREAPLGDLLDHYAGVLDEPNAALFVGTIDDTIVGFASLSVEKLADHTSLGVIHELYVDPEARSVGVGESLADSCLKWCANKQCRGVDARALPGNRAAKNFFEINGFVARSITMYRAIEPTA